MPDLRGLVLAGNVAARGPFSITIPRQTLWHFARPWSDPPRPGRGSGRLPGGCPSSRSRAMSSLVHAPVSRSLPPLVDEPELCKDFVTGVEQRRQFALAVDEFAFLNLGAP
jgi:hypothetical protein